MAVIQSKQKNKLSKEDELLLGGKIKYGLQCEESLAKNHNVYSEHEIHRMRQAVEAGKRAEEELVAANINLVVSIAMKHKERYPYGPDVEERIQDGFSGLVIAARKYDPDQGNKFSTMAFAWIRQSVSRGVNSGGKLVRLPENRITQYAKISKIEQDLLSSQGVLSRKSLDTMITEEMTKKFPSFTFHDLVSIRNASAEYSSLNRRMDDGSSSSAELLDMIAEESMDYSAEHEVIEQETREKLKECLETLDDVAQDVVMSNFGMRLFSEPDSTSQKDKPVGALDTGTMYQENMGDTENTGHTEDTGGISNAVGEEEGETLGQQGYVLSASHVREKHGIKPAKYRKILERSLVSLRSELHQRGLSFADFV